jgi:putative transposase
VTAAYGPRRTPDALPAGRASLAVAPCSPTPYRQNRFRCSPTPNSRNGTRAKTVLTDIGSVALEVPRDRDSSFQPKIVRKRQRRLGGVDDLVVSLVAKGLTTGEVQAQLAEIYGTEVSRQTISTVTDRVLEGLAAWQSRPLDPVYPVIFIDAINVKLRDGSVADRPSTSPWA